MRCSAPGCRAMWTGWWPITLAAARRILAVDVPSGVDGADGAIAGPCSAGGD